MIINGMSGSEPREVASQLVDLDPNLSPQLRGARTATPIQPSKTEACLGSHVRS